MPTQPFCQTFSNTLLCPPPNVSKTRWAGYLAFALSGQRLVDSLFPLQEAILNCYQQYDTPDFDNLCDELARIFVQSSTFKSGEVHYKREVVLTAIAALRAMKNNFESVFSVKKGFMHEIADRIESLAEVVSQRFSITHIGIIPQSGQPN